MEKEIEGSDGRYEIIVNAEKISWKSEKITYSEVVELAFPPPHSGTEMFTVQYSRGPRENTDGTLVDGQDTKIRNGMIFDVTKTDKS